MNELIAAFARGAVLIQDPIHGSRRAQILAFIQQSGLNGGGRAILEALGVEQGAHRFALFGTQRPGRSRASDHGHGQRRTECRLAIEGSARHAESIAGGLDADRGSQLLDGIHQGFPSGSGVSDRPPQQRAHFFLNIDDDLGFAQLFSETRIVLLQLLVFFLDGIALGLRPALLGS